MKHQTPKLRLIQGGKKESKFSLRIDLVLFLFSILLIAILVYKAMYYEY